MDRNITHYWLRRTKKQRKRTLDKQIIIMNMLEKKPMTEADISRQVPPNCKMKPALKALIAFDVVQETGESIMQKYQNNITYLPYYKLNPQKADAYKSFIQNINL